MNEIGKFREYYKHEFHTGAGGSGKTFSNIYDKGFVNICYVAPSWKLATDTAKEYYIKTNGKILPAIPFHHIFQEPYAKTRGNIYKYGVYIIDEASMLTEHQKKYLLKILPRTIFLGDLKYQLEPFIDIPHLIKKYNGYENIPKDMLRQMDLTGFDNIIDHPIVYRFLCDKLKKVAEFVRDNIENKIDYRDLGIQEINRNGLKQIYKKEDIILVSRGATGNITSNYNEEYNELFKNIEKYKVTENSNDYKNGEIIFEDLKGIKSERRHGYTIHSVQGLTFENKIFIDMRNLTGNRMFYTAISRARHLNQIFLII